MRLALAALLALGAANGAAAQVGGADGPGAARVCKVPGTEGASAEATSEAAGLMRIGFVDGFFASFWPSFRHSFVEALHARSGADRDRLSAITDEVVLPAYRAGRPDLECRLRDVLAARFTATQLREMQRDAASTSPEAVPRLTERLAPATAEMQGAVQAWGDRILADNRDAFQAAFRERGLDR